jgi:hypothetical protein
MKRLTALLVVFGLLAGGAYGQKVSVTYVKSTDFSKYKTYAWKPGHTLGKSQILPMELIDQTVLSTIRPIIAAKGLKEVTTNPDVYVTYFVSLTQKSEVGPMDSFDTFGQLGYQASDAFVAPWNESMVTSYRKGILLLDVIDARTSALVWRAHCKRATDQPRDPKGALENAITKALSDFPPQPGK